MASEGLQTPLHILFFPFLAPGHMNPMADMARLFTRQGVKATILTTPANAPLIQPTIDCANVYSNAHSLHPIKIVIIPFPSIEAGLPEGYENLSLIPLDLQDNFQNGLSMLREPFDKVLTDLTPDCVVTDMFLPWTYNVAAEHGIPRLTFSGTSFFSSCVTHVFATQNPLQNLPAEAESFVLPGLPHHIEMLRSQIPDFSQFKPSFFLLLQQIKEVDSRSYGMVVNSFYELEPDYVEYYQKVVGTKAWSIGPVSLCNGNESVISRRGNKSSIDCEVCLKWLDSKTAGSVVYVCFGSLQMSEFTAVQVREIALGLEASGHPFIWVVKKQSDDFLPEGYEERIEGKGLIIKGWAPQVLILNHQAVGGFVTHCGWNSCLEGVSAGLPQVTWPLFAEQFYNERLVVDVLGIGVPVGAKNFSNNAEERAVIGAVEIEKAVNELMGSGEEAKTRRNCARLFKEKAHRALEEGGSSYVDMGNLIKELMDKKNC